MGRSSIGSLFIMLLSMLLSPSWALESYGAFSPPVCSLRYQETNPDEGLFINHLKRSIAVVAPIEFTTKGPCDYIMTVTASEGSPKTIALSLKRKNCENCSDSLFKEYAYKNQSDLIAIANQWGDRLIEQALGFKGALSYPIAYVETVRDGLHHLILADISLDLKTTLYSSPSPIIGLSWSRDASAIAFIEASPQGPLLKVLDLQSLMARTVDSNRFVTSPCFSQDGRFLYYIAETSGENALMRYNLLTGSQETVLSGQAGLIDVGPGWDDFHLLVSSKRTGITQIYEYNLLNKKFKRLTFSHQECMSGLLNAPNDSLFYSLLTQGHSLLMRRSFSDHQTHYVTIEGEAEGICAPPTPFIISFERTDYANNGKKTIVFKSLLSGKETQMDSDLDCYSPSWSPRPGLLRS